MKMLTSSRRDDIINLMQMLIYFRQMDLPWCDFLFCMPCDSPEKTFRIVLQTKEQYTLRQLAEQYGFSTEFQDLAIIVDRMKYDDYPNYARMTRVLEKILERDSEEGPPVFQWK